MVFEPLMCYFGTTSSFFQRRWEAQHSHTLLRTGLEGQWGSMWQGKGDRATVSGVYAVDSDGGWREKVDMLMSSASCLNEVAGILWLQASSLVQGAVAGEGRSKDWKGLDCWRYLWKCHFLSFFLFFQVSFSVGIKELISRVLKGRVGAF